MPYTKKIMYIAGLIFISAIMFLYINIYVIFPSVSDLIVKSTVKEAVLVTKMLSSMVISEEGSFISANIDKAIIVHKKDFDFEKIKIFSADGKIIYSTDPKDIGSFNKYKYFKENVANGEIYTKEVKKDTKTLEGRKVEVDVLETYVPVMDGDRFLGAFEIYYDVTSQNNAINSIVIRYSVLSLFLIFGFMVLSLLILLKEERSESYIELGFLSKIYESPVYIMLILMLSLLIVETLIMRIATFFPELSPSVEAVLDALLLVMLITPVLYLFLLRPISKHIRERNIAEAELKNAHDILEAKVKERTIQLSNTILELEDQVVIRKKAEEGLLLFRKLIGQSNDCIYVINPKTGNFKDVSENACRSLGYKYEQLLLMNVKEIEAVIPDHFSWENHVAELQEKGSMLAKGRHKRKDGTTYPVEVNIRYVKHEESDYIVAVARDITDRI